MTASLGIRLLGEFNIVCEGSQVPTITRPRWQSLLAYLLLHRGIPQPRRHLAFVLWPDSSERQALTNLRHVLHHVLHLLPEPARFIDAAGPAVTWRADAPCTLDVSQFEAALAADRTADSLRAAIDLYRGELLPGLYDDWLLPERERLHQAAIAACEELAARLEEQAEFAGVIAVAQHLLRLDPLREDTYRQLMRLHALHDDRAAAFHVYQRCVKVLQRELNVEPAPATRALAARILNMAAPGAAAPPAGSRVRASLPLAGRAAEWSLLQECWRTAGRGRAELLVISGEAGVGKTRLAEELVDWVSRQGWPAAMARCYEAEGTLAFTPIADWMRALLPCISAADNCELPDFWLSEVARVVPEVLVDRPGLVPPGPLVEPWQRRRFFEALARAVLAAGSPMLLVIDDLQWSDRDTLEWLRFLMHFSPNSRLLVVGLLRPEEAAGRQPLRELLSSLRQARQLTELEVRPLDRAVTAALAERMAGRKLDQEMLDRVYRATEGNALFVLETTRALLAGADLAQGLPSAVHAVIARRLEQLSPPARQLAGVAAVLGRSFSFRLLARASRMRDEDVVQGLDELWAKRIVRVQGSDDYDFTHDRLRDAAYDALSPARRRSLHAHAAEALLETFAGAELANGMWGQVAVHFEKADLREQAIDYYWRAAEAARHLYSNVEAIDALQRALALSTTCEMPDDGTAAMHERLGDLLQLVGRPAAAREAFGHMLDCLPAGDRVGQARAWRKHAQTWIAERRWPEADEALSRADARLAGLEGVASRLEWIEVQLASADRYYWSLRTCDIARVLECARPVVEQHGARVQRVALQRALVLSLFRRDRFRVGEETLAVCREYVRLAEQTGNARTIAEARTQLGVATLAAGLPQQALDILLSAWESVRRVSDVTTQTIALTILTLCWRQLQMAPVLEAHLDELEKLAYSCPRHEYAGVVVAHRAWLAWRAGCLTETIALGEAALTLWTQQPEPYTGQMTALWPMIAARLGFVWDAREIGSGAGAAPLPVDPAPADAVQAAVEHARALLAPPQFAVPPDIAEAISAALTAHDQGDIARAHDHLWIALQMARERRYL
jgi:DNA-binding SARP family transcriptional activator/tetratricopeptide (TPR) repeat protein